MRRILAGSMLAAALPLSLGAQGLQESAVIASPQMAQYTFSSGAGGQTVSQFSVPLVVLLPFSERFNMDIATAFATSELTGGGATVSKISGLTDTQIRANFSLGSELLVFTVGVNLPSGQYLIPADQIAAAGQIGNDFLGYPISSMGNGFAGTGGIAYARALGAWNLGAGGSFRKSAEFDFFERDSGGPYRFEPADEMRARLSLDRPVGDGQVSLGVSYSAFGEDFADTTTYSTGDRITLTGGWSFPVRSATMFISGWNLFRLEGKQVGGDAPRENVSSLNLGVSFNAGEMLIQPNIEARLWQVASVRSGQLVNIGTRVRFSAGAFSLYPAFAYSIGKTFVPETGAAQYDVTGFRGSLTIRFR